MARMDIIALIESGEDPNKVVNGVSYWDLLENLEYILAHKTDPLTVAGILTSSDIIAKMGSLRKYGLDANDLFPSGRKHYLKDNDINENVIMLLDCGVDPNKFKKRLTHGKIIKHLEPLLAHGTEPNYLMKRMDSDEIDKNKETLVKYNASINLMVRLMKAEHVKKNREFLAAHHATNLSYYGYY